jgi:hypothetical protein
LCVSRSASILRGMRLFTGTLSLLCCVFLLQPAARADEFSEAQRLLGFAEHKKRILEMDREREAHADEVKKQKQAWEIERLKALDAYKASKTQQAQSIDENSPQYLEDLEIKKKQAEQLEASRREYVVEKSLKRQELRKLLSRIKLTEAEELGLVPEPERVDPSKRALYGGKPSFAGKVDFAGTPSDNRGSQPPPPPPPPEFFEPEPPPPPPVAPLPEPVFEDAIPPPIFDDPEF